MVRDTRFPERLHSALGKNDSYWEAYWQTFSEVAHEFVDEYLKENAHTTAAAILRKQMTGAGSGKHLLPCSPCTGTEAAPAANAT